MSLGSVGKNLGAINEIAKSQPQVLQAIKQAAQKTGVDFAYLVQKAGVESSFNPEAKAKTSSASGLFQFVKGTWLDMVDRHGEEYGLAKEAAAIERGSNGKLTVKDAGERERILALRNNPSIAAAMAAELAAENTAALSRKVGGKIGATEMYLAHFLGSEGAGTLLGAVKDRPNAAGAALLPSAAASNRNVFYTEGGRARTVSEIYNNFAAKFDDSAKVEMAAAQTGAFKPVDVAPVEPVKMNPVQVLAVITADKQVQVASNEPVAAEPASKFNQIRRMAVADASTAASISNVSDTMQGLVASDSLFRAMQFAEKLLDSDGQLAGKGRAERAERVWG